jgi:hypothetical protein
LWILTATIAPPIFEVKMLDITISGLYEASLWAPTHTKVISIVDPTTPVFECDVPHHVERFHDIEVPLEGY